ncbi:hypothetical protein SK128_000808 [Halocaridina rubra]|uniref:Torsin-1A-interacting protein 1/2 AAA+ activator domain-containing protein n=1 Tax=Halocaridina rubra TaxID=373956 RepID=A0AAN9A7R3_HALRR
MSSDGRPTARRGLRSKSTSPYLQEGSTNTRSRAKEGRSPIRRNANDCRDQSDENHYSDNDGDAVDCAYKKDSPLLYPDLEDDLQRLEHESGSSPGWSPNKKNSDVLLEDSYGTTKSQCISRTPPSGQKTNFSKNLPVTVEKGSPGRRIHQSPEDLPSRPRRGMVPILSIGFLLLIAFCIVTLHQSLKNVEELSKPKPKIKSLEEVYRDIKMELRLINSQFSQSKHFWIQLLGQLETIMVKDPIQPAVILAVVPEGAERTAVCLLHQICHAVSNSFEGDTFVLYDVKSELHKGSSHLKYDLHQEMLRLGQAHAAIVHNVEKIPGSAAMTFHAFCDNENAPFKQALIFLALNLPAKYGDLSEERLENTIDDYLLGLWSEELPQKDVSAVVSRVANAPVLIKPEETDVLAVVCANI